MPQRTFVEIPVGTPFHFLRGEERDPATWVKIGASEARSQAGGEVVTTPPGTVVVPVGL